MVKPLFLGNWTELIAHDIKIPLDTRKLNETSSYQIIGQNKTARYGSLIFAESTLMYNVSFKQFSKLCLFVMTAVFLLQSWQLQVYAGECVSLFCDKLL